MADTSPSRFRNALQVTPDRIARMSESELGELMRALLLAQAYRCHSPASQVRVNTAEKAPDDGCDGWTDPPDTADDWLGTAHTCWQFKAGKAGTPSKLRGEVCKPIPSKALSDGGHFVLIASGSTDGVKGERARTKTLVEDAKAANLQTERIRVIGSETLCTWCNQHPAIAARWAGMPDGLCTLSEWSRDKPHQSPWQDSGKSAEQMTQVQKALDFGSDAVMHVHVAGSPGVGKTRFVLELCRGAEWASHVVYFRQASDERLSNLIDRVAQEPNVRLTVVADEVDTNDLRQLCDAVSRAEGRIRLISIGHCRSTELQSRVTELLLSPLTTQSTEMIVRGWFPAMPIEHVEFVARFSNGYMRLANFAAEAVMRDSAIAVHDLVQQPAIRKLFDTMLGKGDRRALYVVALLSSIGWEGDAAQEGEAVANHLGLDWNTVRYQVEDFNKEFGIAPRGGRRRYISPVPLGIHLAVEAWLTFPDLLRTLPNVLPTEAAREAYDERLRSIASSPSAKPMALAELNSSFFLIGDFAEPKQVRRWFALSAADPRLAARKLRQAIERASLEERLELKDRARIELVSTTSQLAWSKATFADATKALAWLAEAENASWSNNATGEFLSRFQLIGGTALPYLERLHVLDELAVESRPKLTALVVQALTRVVSNFGTRLLSIISTPDGVIEPEWKPPSKSTEIECATAALARLTTLVREGAEDLAEVFVSAALDFEMLLLEDPLRGKLIQYFEATRARYPRSREPLRRLVSSIMLRDQAHWHELSSDGLSELSSLCTRFEDSSFVARLEQYVGPSRWDREDETIHESLAKELLGSSDDAFATAWIWLTSGEAGDAWQFGETLSQVDTAFVLTDRARASGAWGRDQRVLCGYAKKLRTTQGDSWFDNWFKLLLPDLPGSSLLLVEVAWRCGLTAETAPALQALIRRRDIDANVIEQLSFGKWVDEVATSEIATILSALIDSQYFKAALNVLDRRLKAKREDAVTWRDHALELVCSPTLLRSHSSTQYHWHEVAKVFAADAPTPIATAIMQAHAQRSGSPWFIKDSRASDILFRCAKLAPEAVWNALREHLDNGHERLMFAIGFPLGLVDQAPREPVLSWVEESPLERSSVLARFVHKDFSTDETLCAIILGRYGDNEDVAQSFLSAYCSGSWSGPPSAHWKRRAEPLKDVVARSRLPKLRDWASEAVQHLEQRSDLDRTWEEERELLGR